MEVIDISELPRAWERVLHHLEARLLSGELGPGDHLPPERFLAVNLGVGRSSVREAMRVLDVLGLVRTQTGSGPQAGAIIIAAPSGGMSTLMTLQVAAKGFAVGDVVKTRLVLESAVVAELAQTDADLEIAETLLDAMDANDLTPEEFLALDAQFHLALAESSGNQVIGAMMEGIRNSIESYVLHGIRATTNWPVEASQLRTEHRGILAAIVNNDAVTASIKVREHITGYYSRTKLTEQDHS